MQSEFMPRMTCRLSPTQTVRLVKFASAILLFLRAWRMARL